MPNKVVWFFLIIGVLLSSCDSNVTFDEYKTVPDQWHKDSIISFEINPPDSTKTYNLFVNIRNTNAYKYSNLYLIIDMKFPNGKTIKDTLEYDMAKPNGELLGEGFTDIKDNKLWYKEAIIFNEKGTYKIDIQHAMRKNGSVEGIDNLEGITDIGFRIEPTKNN